MSDQLDNMPLPDLTLDPFADIAPAVKPASAPAPAPAPAPVPAAPTLTTPVPAPAAPAPAVEKKEEQRVIALSPAEQKMVEEFIPKISIHDSGMITQYGAGAQKKIADFSENMLGSVRTKDLGEVGEMLTGVVTQLKEFEAEDEPSGFLGFFKRNNNKVTAMRAKYDKAELNVDRICTALESHQVVLMKDIALLDKMYALNVAYYKELCMYIVAGRKKLQMVRETELAQLTAKAAQSGLPEDAQAANDLANLCGRFEKKLHDLDLTRIISIQMAPQIRMIQNNDTQMVDKIQSTIVNTIPLWKSQMVLSLGVEHSRQAAAAQQQVTNLTNDLLKKNAEMLKMTTVETAREAERGIVDIETLRQTNESLISTLDEVMRIQEEGHQKRVAAEAEIGKLEDDLKQKLLSIRR